MTHQRMPTAAQAGAVATVVFAAFAGCMLASWPTSRAAEVIYAATLPTLSVVFVSLAMMLAASARGRLRAAWVAMSVGLTAWSIAEAIWAYHALAGRKVPIPSWADAAYLVFLVGVATALLLFPNSRSRRGQGRTILDGVILTGSFFLIAWLVVLRAIWLSDVGGVRFAASLIYPAGDFLLLTIAFLVLIRVTAGLRIVMALLVAALACIALTDSVWAYLSNANRYGPGGVSDIIAVGAALLIIMALIAATRAEAESVPTETSPGRLTLWLPLVPLAFAALVVARTQPAVVTEAPVVATGVVLIVATLIRQALEAAEAARREKQVRVLADRLSTELSSAARYVASILPGELTGPVGVTSRYLPARAVGGDSFGYAWLGGDDADHLIVYLIDVSGHGVEPALLSVSVHNLLRSGSLPDDTLREPDQVLAELNDLFGMESHGGHYFTMWYGVYQRSTGLLRYASAGHPPALALTREGDRITATPLGGGSMPVGMFDDSEFTVESYQVPPATWILIYSDGVLGEPPQMAEFISECTELAGAQSFSLESLVEVLPTEADGPGNDDDQSMVLLTFAR